MLKKTANAGLQKCDPTVRPSKRYFEVILDAILLP
jgi:hypothetical protein